MAALGAERRWRLRRRGVLDAGSEVAVRGRRGSVLCAGRRRGRGGAGCLKRAHDGRGELCVKSDAEWVWGVRAVLAG